MLEMNRWAQERVPCGVTGVTRCPQCRRQCHAGLQGCLGIPRATDSALRGDRGTWVSPVLCAVTPVPRCLQGKVPGRVTVLCLDIAAAGDSQCHGQVFPVQVTVLCKVTGFASAVTGGPQCWGSCRAR